ncbi:hypothetical protein EV360DRAFT_75430 [Lentinula raphanica]|nr:hypothetical protein EV360DRAFT_75430 [Lentinula raphanica]
MVPITCDYINAFTQEEKEKQQQSLTTSTSHQSKNGIHNDCTFPNSTLIFKLEIQKIIQDIMRTNIRHIIATHMYNAEGGTDDIVPGAEGANMECFRELLCTMQNRFDLLDHKMELQYQQLLGAYQYECKSPGIFAYAHNFKIHNATFIAAGRDCISYYNNLREADNIECKTSKGGLKLLVKWAIAEHGIYESDHWEKNTCSVCK